MHTLQTHKRVVRSQAQTERVMRKVLREIREIKGTVLVGVGVG